MTTFKQILLVLLIFIFQFFKFENAKAKNPTSNFLLNIAQAKNLNLEFEDQSGQLNAENISFLMNKTIFKYHSPNFLMKIKKVNDNTQYLNLTNSKNDIFIPYPGFLDGLKSLKLEDTQLIVNNEDFILVVQDLYFETLTEKKSDKFNFYKFINSDLHCLGAEKVYKNSGISDIELINSCINDGLISIKKIIFTNNILTRIISDILPEKNELSNDQDLNNLKNFSFTIKKSDFNLNFEIDAMIDVTVKSIGTIKRENNILVINLEKAKVGFINVLDQIFKSLSKIKSKSIKVEKPNIFIYLND